MAFIIILCFIGLMGIGAVWTGLSLIGDIKRHRALEEKNREAALEAAMKPVSYAAQEILSDLNNIPEDNRPNVDLKPVLGALDEKFGVEKTNNHFTFIRGSELVVRPTQFSWSCKCESRNKYSERCPFYEYFKLHTELRNVTRELEQQEVALAKKRDEERIADLQPILNEIPLIVDRIREEREIVKLTTKELTA